MGNDEAVTPSKSDKAPSPLQVKRQIKEQPAIHPYPDWAAMQAYYSPGVPMPPPYFSTTVAPGHPPHPYMWGPQPLLPSFGASYTAIYPHGIYSHPSVSLMASPSTTDAPAKSSSNKDRGSMKRLKGFDGLAVSIGNVNAEITVGDGSMQSQSEENGAEGSSDGTDEINESGGKETQRKSSENTPTSGDRKAGMLPNAVQGGETNATPNMSLGVTIPPSTITGIVPASGPIPGMEFRVSTSTQLKAGVHPEPWIQDERELKRERRKQSNRESARRSRLRKQAETEELAMKVETLSAENTTLRSEISQLKENSEKLRAENSALTEKLKNVQEMSPDKREDQEAPSVVAENFLSRIDKLTEDGTHENSNSGKLRQLFDSSPRTDAVAAG